MHLSRVRGGEQGLRASESTHEPQGHTATMALVADTVLGQGEARHVQSIPTMRTVALVTQLMPKERNLSTVRQPVSTGTRM